MAEILMPQLGESVTEGTITQWFKAVGDSVAVDEVLFEVSTDKVDTEVPSPAAGVLTEIRAEEGATVEVGEVIAVVGDAAPAQAEPGQAEPPQAAPAQAAPAQAAPVTSQPVAAEPVATQAAPAPAPTPASPFAPAPTEPVASVAPPPDPMPAAPVPAAPVPAAAAPVSAPADSSAAGVVLSPVVRRLLDESGLSPADVVGTGIGGRITREDVQRAIDARGVAMMPPAASAVSPAATPASSAPPAVSTQPAPASSLSTPVVPAPSPAAAAEPAPSGGVQRPGGVVIEPFNKIRKITGDLMVASKSISPHVITAVEVDFERVEQARRANKERFKSEEGFSLTYLPFVSRAVVEAVADFPRINATVGTDGLEVHHDINLAYAVDLDFEGLLAPVLHQAGDKRLAAIAREIKSLADRARSKRLTPNDLAGGTFTISNSGSYGTFLVAPIINQPQVAILSTDGVARKPVVVTDSSGNESLAIHSVGLLTLSWDHRAFDGAYAAAFMQRLREEIETRDWMSEL
jgi:2-oxoglutarate dehydrogenase E2 component (dihydrolipoamide succinyltransferase)